MEAIELDRIADDEHDRVMAMQQTWLTNQGKHLKRQRRRDALLGAASFALGVVIIVVLLAHIAAGM